jgi:hypothetical protein
MEGGDGNRRARGGIFPGAASPTERASLSADTDEQKTLAPSLPAMTLPKGGGAISGIGEKLAANPVTGIGAVLVPIAASPGRSGFGPQLSLSYDSRSANGAYSFGWYLSLSATTREADKCPPRHQGAAVHLHRTKELFLLIRLGHNARFVRNQRRYWWASDRTSA